MTTDPCPELSNGVPPLSSADLKRLLQRCLDRHQTRDPFQPAITIYGFAGDSTEVLRRGLDRPEDAILGFDLPMQFSALGIVASSVVATPPHRTHRDAALALAVSRTGHTVSMLVTSERVIATSQPQGWLLDACQRAAGLETTACDTAALAFPIALWLDRLMIAILNTKTSAPVTWTDAVDLCPIPARWRSDHPIDLGTTLGSTTRSWRALRAAAAEGAATPFDVSPERARWMDDAMFARWCLGSFPDINNLRSDVEFLASDQVAGNVALALRAAWSAFAG